MHARFKKKLGMTKKRVAMQRLTEENQRILRRIQEVPPAYNHLEWEEDAKRKEHIKRCMALYPEFYERQDKEKERRKSAELTQYKSQSAPLSSSMNRSSSPNPFTLPKINK